MQVTYPTTPAQYFHLLRRQMTLNPRKPLVVMTPKSLLRNPQATSTREELLEGGFQPLIDDAAFASGRDRGSVRRIVLSAGKVHYDLRAARDKSEQYGVALARLEQFYPWPQKMISDMIASYPNLEEVVWVQEEPRNMGGWNFVRDRIAPLLAQRGLRYVGRPISASPATGSHRRHEEEQHALVEQAVTL